MDKKDIRGISRNDWSSEIPVNLETINTGSLQRIADSLEKMEKPFDKLIRDNEYYRERNKRQQDRIQSLERSNSALKGHITRLKKKEVKGE